MTPFRVLLALVLLGLLVAPVRAQQPVTTQTLTVTATTAVGLSTTTISPAGAPAVGNCQGQVQGGSVLVWATGATPAVASGSTPASGFWLNPGSLFWLTSFIASKQFLAVAVGATATIQFQCARGADMSGSLPPLVVNYDPGTVGVSSCNALLKASGYCR
jgi:hypothetical protein